MTFSEYLETLKHKTVAVIGIGVSNRPLIEALLRSGVAVTACDKKEREALDGQAEALEALGARLRLGPDYLTGLDQDVIFRTPGLRPDRPELAAAVRQGSTLTSEMEVFFEVCPCPIIAVTGSDGKTTTTTIIAELLKAAGRTVHGRQIRGKSDRSDRALQGKRPFQAALCAGNPAGGREGGKGPLHAFQEL